MYQIDIPLHTNIIHACTLSTIATHTFSYTNSHHTNKVQHTQHSAHRSLTLCPLHTREHNSNRHWSHIKLHSPYPDGWPGHPYSTAAAHTQLAPQLMHSSVGSIPPVKISAYNKKPYNNPIYMYTGQYTRIHTTHCSTTELHVAIGIE